MPTPTPTSLAPELIASFVEAACVPLDRGHASGTLDAARKILHAHPGLAAANIYTAAILGEAGPVERFLEADPASATAAGGPRNWDALTYLCFSRFLRLEAERSEGLVRSARALLDHGASATTGWYETNHQPAPEWECVLYGAAGVAHHEGLTRLLLERGADPNDGEVAYHAPEGWDNGALQAVVATGRVTPANLAAMLLRKADWHDLAGVKWLLAHGADPNRLTPWGKTALHNAALSDNSLEIFEALLDHGGDPSIVGTHPEACRSAAGRTATALAARRGRGDVLDLLVRRGRSLELHGVDELIAACARGDAAQVQGLAREAQVNELVANGGRLLVEFAGNGNTEGVRRLLEIGVGIDALHPEGDGYFGLAANSTALHAAAWRARPDTVRELLRRGARVDAQDGAGRGPLALAVSACVDSYWTDRRSPDSVAALLQAGASLQGVPFPSGYDAVDDLLRSHGAVAPAPAPR